MANYNKTKILLKNFYTNKNLNSENNLSHTFFYQKDDLHCDIKNVYYFVVCQKSSGNGDLFNAIKTYFILKKYFTNVFVLVKKDDIGDHIATMYPSKNIRIVTIELLEKSCRDSIKIAASKKIFIMCALPMFKDRFNAIPKPKKYLFIDEYNGWRVRYVDTNIDTKTEPDTNNQPSETDIKCYKDRSHDKLECQKCLENEFNLVYRISPKLESPGNNFCISSGIGITKHNMQTIGVHIMAKELYPTQNKFLKYFFKKIKHGKYYFIYFSCSEQKNDNTVFYLDRFFDVIQKLNENKGTNFIIIDPIKYLYAQNHIIFRSGDIVAFHDEGYYIQNTLSKNKFLYSDFIDHKDMLSLMKYSEPQIFLTGDQSFIEGISLFLQESTKIILPNTILEKKSNSTIYENHRKCITI